MAWIEDVGITHQMPSMATGPRDPRADVTNQAGGGYRGSILQNFALGKSDLSASTTAAGALNPWTLLAVAGAALAAVLLFKLIRRQ